MQAIEVFLRLCFVMEIAKFLDISYTLWRLDLDALHDAFLHCVLYTGALCLFDARTACCVCIGVADLRFRFVLRNDRFFDQLFLAAAQSAMLGVWWWCLTHN